MRPSTILLASLTAVSGAATVVLAVLVGPGTEPGFVHVLRLGGLVTVGFGTALATTVGNRRRRARLSTASGAHPGAVFVDAHATEWTAADLAEWCPGLRIGFPCDLGFDRDGMTVSSGHGGGRGPLVATRAEILGFDVFDDGTQSRLASRWGIAIRLAPRSAGPGRVRLWITDGQPNQDEYAMRHTIARIEVALGR